MPPNESSISGDTCEKVKGDKGGLSLLLTILGSCESRERERERDPRSNVTEGATPDNRSFSPSPRLINEFPGSGSRGRVTFNH